MKNIITWVEENGRLFILILIALIAGLILAFFSLFIYFKQKDVTSESDLIEELMTDPQEESPTESPQDSLEEMSQQNIASEPLKEIVVDIKGEVKTPGVYHMEGGSRIIDVIDKAGGLLDEAETTAVNFAQVLADQMVIYVPKVGEEIPTEHSVSQDNMNNADSDTAKIDINRAEKEALMTLNGIGNSKAENIISYREENGLFETIEDIKNVSGIGEATFNNLKDSIIVSP